MCDCVWANKEMTTESSCCVFFLCWQNDYLTDFELTIETWHKNDMGEEENVSCDLSDKNCLLSHLSYLKRAYSQIKELTYCLLQVHKQSESARAEIVNIDIADNKVIAPKVRLSYFAVSHAARIQFS